MAGRSRAGWRELCVRDLIVGPPPLLEEEETIAAAAARMAHAGVSAAPVLDSRGRLRGLMTDTSIGHHLSSAVHGFYTPIEFRLGVPLLQGRVTPRLARAFVVAGQRDVASAGCRLVVRVPGRESLARLLRGHDAVRREYDVVEDDEIVGAFVLSPEVRRILKALVERDRRP